MREGFCREGQTHLAYLLFPHIGGDLYAPLDQSFKVILFLPSHVLHINKLMQLLPGMCILRRHAGGWCSSLCCIFLTQDPSQREDHLNLPNNQVKPSKHWHGTHGGRGSAGLRYTVSSCKSQRWKILWHNYSAPVHLWGTCVLLLRCVYQGNSVRSTPLHLFDDYRFWFYTKKLVK